jgi:ABC-2 type transport system ATP-binding protein
LIGPNGAGKTTTFRIVATVLRQTAGRVLIGGMNTMEKAHIRDIRRKIGYMPDSFGVYDDMTVQEYLAFFAAAYDIRDPRRQRLVEDVLELVDLTTKRTTLVEALSRGMQQRLGIARVLIHDPEFLILDEPASGLDPRARVEIRSLLLELQKMGKTILISSHILADLGEICNRVGIIEKGELKVDGTLADILESVKPSPIVLLSVVENTRAMAVLNGLPCVLQAREQGDTIAVEVPDGFTEVWRISQALTAAGIKLNYIEQEARSLERAFIELTSGAVS